jgi:L-lactate dehydrogenase complex protein LldG
MSEDSRSAILGRLRGGRVPSAPPASDFGAFERRRFAPAERYPRLRRMMEAVQAEFLETTESEWPGAVAAFASAQGIDSLAYGPATPAGRRLAREWPADGVVRLVPYDRPLESDGMKTQLFDRTGAGFTMTRGGIAETGGLILWPSPDEPRLLSLVPPVHLALLDTAEIFDTFWHAMREQGWAGAMPANALLVSGPSKTADIEQTLAYGVHGPKRLVVVAILPETR